jgi:hypothetical protein
MARGAFVSAHPGTGHNDLGPRIEGLAAEELRATECAQRRDWYAEQR